MVSLQFCNLMASLYLSRDKMAGRRGLLELQLSVTFVLFLLLILETKDDHVPSYGVSSIFVQFNLDTSYQSLQKPYSQRRQRYVGCSPFYKASAGIYLIKLSLSASYLVILAGDVSMNPGPVRDPCGICSKGCRVNQRAVQCDECDVWYHSKCLGLTGEEFMNLAKPDANWSCMVCLFPQTDFMESEFDRRDLDNWEGNSKQAKDEPKIRMLRGLKIAHLNVNRLINKLDSIKELVSDYSFDILALTETWLTSDIEDGEISIPGYSTVRSDRDKTKSSKSCGGGILVYIRDGLPFVTNSVSSVNSNAEFIWVDIKRPRCKPVNLCCAYRPGDISIDSFISDLELGFTDMDSTNSEMVLLGDFNIDYSKKNHLRRSFDDFALRYGLNQLVSKPTRVTENSSTIIDLILVSNMHRIVQCDVLDSSLSDHNLVFCVIKGGVKKLPSKNIEYRSFKNFHEEAFIRDLGAVPWNSVESFDNIDDAVFLWERLFIGVADQHAPIKTKRVKANQSPWISPKLLEVRHDRDYHRKKAQNSSSQYHWQMYRKLRNYANHEEKRLKSAYYCKLIEDAKNNSSKMWKAIKETLPSNQVDVNCISVDGKTVSDPKGIAESFNYHFSNVGKKLAKLFSPHKFVQHTITN